jgi:hypothetical protein
METTMKRSQEEEGNVKEEGRAETSGAGFGRAGFGKYLSD